MSISDDPGLAVRLRDEVDALVPAGLGPSLSQIRRRGARRRHRTRAAAAVSVLSVLGLAGTLASSALNRADSSDDRLTAASGASRAGTSAPELIDAVLREHGVANPAYPAGEIIEDPTQRRLGWGKRWQVTDRSPKVTVSVSVFPQRQDVVPADLPCAGDPARARSCTDVTGADGVRVVSGITSDDTVGRQRTALWAPSAVAIYPDGRQVVMAVELLLLPSDDVPANDVTYEYAGPLTLPQLQAVVADPDLSAIPN